MSVKSQRKLNKKKLIERIALAAGNTLADTERIVDAVFCEMMAALENEEEVHIQGFGVFEVRTRAARQGVNPRTKERIVIPECRIAAFRQGTRMKARLNSKQGT